MSEPRVHRFRASVLRLFPEVEYAETVFPDGAAAGATRECEVGNRIYARHLGYDECWPAMVEHEAAHTFLAERLGHRWSPTLHAEAHGCAPGTAPYEERLFEEALVLSFQRWLHTGEVLPVLQHPDVAPFLYRWGVEFRELAERLLRDPEAA